jgi:hypothetical protein
MEAEAPARRAPAEPLARQRLPVEHHQREVHRGQRRRRPLGHRDPEQDLES